MDVFGFDTQGINYDKFRPRYPLTFIQKSLKAIKHKGRYLDIATGTGQLLFAFAPYFSFNKGTDISKNMIQNAIKANESFHISNPLKQVSFQISDVMQLNELQKYDFITVGQALHFFPYEAPMKKIRSLLAPSGCFAAFGYIPKEILSTNEKQTQIYNTFYNKIKPHFPIDRDDLHTFFTNPQKYPFQKLFSRVQRQIQEVPLPMNKLQYISYLKTMTGYNLYLQKFQDDPLQQLSKVCAEEVTIIYPLLFQDLMLP